MMNSNPARRHPVPVTPGAPRWAIAAITSVLLALGCASMGRYAFTALENRDWRLVELRGQAAVPSTGMRETGFRLSADSMRMSGFGGCNRMGGTYSRDGYQLSFGPILSTRMACADARLNRQETELVAALQATNRYEFAHDTLILARDREPLARLASAPR